MMIRPFFIFTGERFKVPSSRYYLFLYIGLKIYKIWEFSDYLLRNQNHLELLEPILKN